MKFLYCGKMRTLVFLTTVFLQNIASVCFKRDYNVILSLRKLTGKLLYRMKRKATTSNFLLKKGPLLLSVYGIYLTTLFKINTSLERSEDSALLRPCSFAKSLFSLYLKNYFVKCFKTLIHDR